MNTTNRILAVCLSLGLIILILVMIKNKKLKEKYAILWLFSGTVIFILAVFDKVLEWVTILLGITLSINTVFFFGIFFMILINLHFSLVISNLTEQNKIIAQKLSLLEVKIDDLINNKQ